MFKTDGISGSTEEIHCLCALLDGVFSKFGMLCYLFLVCLVMVPNKDVQVQVQVQEDICVRCVVVSAVDGILQVWLSIVSFLF